MIHDLHKAVASNPFKGIGSLVLRRLLGSPDRQWTAIELANDLGLSSPWCNKVLNALESEELVERKGRGPVASTRLVDPNELMKQWKTVYRWSRNSFHAFVHKSEGAIYKLAEAAEREGWQYAATGVSVTRLQSKTNVKGPETVFVSPRDKGYTAYRKLLLILQSKYGFHKVLNNPDILVVNPVLGRAVYYDSIKIGKLRCVSPLQLQLDSI